jgi:orotate phosphoribosyltransferase
MPSFESPQDLLLTKLRKKSVFFGEFTLASGAKSSYYIDCRLTTLDAEGACLVGRAMYAMIREEIERSGVTPVAVGGLTMGADPIAVAVGMNSWMQNPEAPLQIFSVRKAPKAHGQTKLIEGNFNAGDSVVIVEDTVTRGDSTLKAIEAVEQAGGKVAFVAVLVDRCEGGSEKIAGRGYKVLSLFKREQLLAGRETASVSGG